MQSNILNFNEDDDNNDVEYFRDLIESKLESKGGSYIEQLAVREAQGDEFDPEGKCSLSVGRLVG